MTDETLSKKFSKKGLVEEIAADLNIRVEVVEVILGRLVDISVEKIVNNEDFSLMNVFSVNSHNEGNVVVPENPNGDGSVPKPMSGRKKLHSRLSRNIRALYRLQNDMFPDKPYLVNRDNWRDALKWSKQKPKENVPPKAERTVAESHSTAIPPESPQFDDLFYDDELD